MPYVERDNAGRIVAAYVEQRVGAAEHLPPEHKDLRAFLGIPGNEIMGALVASDLEMARVLEDLVDALVERGVILLTDLPPAAQEKLYRRGILRRRLSDPGALISDDDGVI